MSFIKSLLYSGDQTYFPKNQYGCPNAVSNYSNSLEGSSCKAACPGFINACNAEVGNQQYALDNCDDICTGSSDGGGDSRRYDRDSQGPFVFQECKNNIDPLGDSCKQDLFNCCNKGCEERQPGNYVCKEQCHGGILMYCKDRPSPQPSGDDQPPRPSPFVPRPEPSGPMAQQTSIFNATNLSIGAVVILSIVVAVLLMKRK